MDILSSRGRALMFIARNPGCTGKEIADKLCLTPRSVWGLVGQLRRAGFLETTKDGRVCHYTVRGVILRELMRELSMILATYPHYTGGAAYARTS